MASGWHTGWNAEDYPVLRVIFIWPFQVLMSLRYWEIDVFELKKNSVFVCPFVFPSPYVPSSTKFLSQTFLNSWLPLVIVWISWLLLVIVWISWLLLIIVWISWLLLVIVWISWLIVWISWLLPVILLYVLLWKLKQLGNPNTNYCFLATLFHMTRSPPIQLLKILAPGKCVCYFKCVNLKHISVMVFLSISSEVAFKGMPWNRISDRSTLVQIMAWCHHATGHYMNQCWLRSMMS